MKKVPFSSAPVTFRPIACQLRQINGAIAAYQSVIRLSRDRLWKGVQEFGRVAPPRVGDSLESGLVMVSASQWRATSLKAMCMGLSTVGNRPAGRAWFRQLSNSFF
jgi:hypothetical protein